jgi:hypothetical protein
VATIYRGCIEPAQTVITGEPKVIVFLEAASQTFKRGAGVYLLNGYLTVSAAASIYVGFAAEDAHNGATAGLYSCAVYIAESTTIFRGNISSGASDATLVQADVGRQFGLYVDSTTGQWWVDRAGTSRVIVQELVDNVGDVNGKVLFKVMGKYRQLDSTSG